ncbi:MAG: acylneuraminate cytidylyltransferase family protein [Phycisphaerales bacterium]|nr:acylneuraminate cytidylyltransferase family protein [Phycisphaerales bacterium]
MGALAVILARSGSKGVPGKNVAPVAGRPCIAWTIDDAKRAQTVSRIVVSTDGEEIARVARSAGVEVVMRPPELASDTARVDDAARHAALEAERTGTPGDPIVILYANVPVRPEGLIDRTVRMLLDTTADSAQSFAPVGKHHPWWTARVDGATGALRPWEGLTLNHGVFRRQDLPPAFVPDGGSLAVSRRALFLQVSGVAAGPHAFFGSDRRGVVTGEGEVVDIDTEIDLLVADAMLQRRKPSPIGSIGRKSA